MTIEFNQDEIDSLGNAVDGIMEDWLDCRDQHPFGTEAWRCAHEEMVHWLYLSMKLGAKYENVTLGGE